MELLQTKCLIVDDDPSFAHFMGELLEETFLRENRRATLKIVYNAEDAIKAIRSDIFDLLVTDTNMPGMNGIELAKNVREIAPKLWVIVLFSGLFTDRKLTREDVFKFGANQVMSKSEFTADPWFHLSQFGL